jgi:hypothetical protein
MQNNKVRVPLPKGKTSLVDQLKHFVFSEGGPAALRFAKLDEAEQLDAGKMAVRNAWGDIRSRMKGLEYGDIHASKGDVTSFKGYKDLEGAINILVSLASASKDPSAVRLLSVDRALQNLMRYKQDFTIGYSKGDELIQSIYANLVVALVKTTARFVASCVDYVKSSNGTMSTRLKPVTMAQENFEDSLVKFNSYCETGKMDQFFNSAGRKGNLVQAVFIGAVVIASVGLFVWLLREMVYQYFRTRVTLAEDLRGMALFTQLNASNIATSNPGAAKNQMQIVDQLQEWADKIDVDSKLSSKAAAADLATSDRSLSANASYSNGDPAEGNLL